MTVTSFGPWAWVLFGAIVLVMLVVDLRRAPERHVGLRASAVPGGRTPLPRRGERSCRDRRSTDYR